MIHVRPASTEEIAKIYGESTFNGANAMIADDTETGKTVGHSKFSIVDGNFTIIDITPAEKDIWLCDLIARATMNYAVNRSILMCCLAETAPKHAFKLLGYIENEEVTEINIIKLFTVCKNCGKNVQNT